MNGFDSLLAGLHQAGVRLNETGIRRGNELHCRVDPHDLPRFAEIAAATTGARLILMAGEDRRAQTGAFFVHYLFAAPRLNRFVHPSVRLDARRPELPSLARFHYPASRFERELNDLFGIRIPDHPDPSRLVRHGFWPDDYYPLRKDAQPPVFTDDGRPFPFTVVGGEGVFEIPVGPVHAGVIEPGHFRFSVLGETIVHMRSRLYFTHKGTEKLFEGRSPHEGLELAERISGDTTAGHALAYSQAIEAASGVEAPRRARFLRVLLLELERLYNHVADFGAIANDTGFGVAHAHCYRIRERLLRLNKRVTGSRLLRGAIIPGGVAIDLPAELDVAGEVSSALADFEEIVQICLENTLLRDRLDATGVLDTVTAAEQGALGFVARASGIDLDARRDHPFAAYGDLTFSVPVLSTGDVKARALVRVQEARESAAIISQVCRELPAGDLAALPGPLAPFQPAFGIVEGWRGRIVHWLMAGEDGRLHRVKIVDPSFLNWPALALALVDNIVPDFPLCNKSFNQSYSGNDL